MKTLKIFLATGAIFIWIPAYAGMTAEKETAPEEVISETRKIEFAIAADREKIILEDEAIKADMRDIEKRRSVIKELKKRISDNKDRKNDIVYGKQIIPKRDYEAR